MKSKMRRFHFDVGAIFADIRYGARAFFTLKGYASRNRETELTSKA